MADRLTCQGPPLLEIKLVTVSGLFRCASAGALGLLIATIPLTLAAQAPSPQDLQGITASGSYLAARHAGQQRDAAAAAAYYRSALRTDPKNTELLNRAFLAFLIDGEVDESLKLADRVLLADKNDRVARLVIGVRSIKQKQYAAARTHLTQSVRGPITDLTATLLNAWSYAGAGDSKNAVAVLDRLAGPEWYAIFKDLHAGMILDAAGNKKDAGKRFERAYKADGSALRVVEAYGSWLSRNGQTDEAMTVFETFDKLLPRHPLIVAAMDKLKKGEKLPPIVGNAQAGAAEALYGLGASLGRRGGEDLAIVYLQLALFLTPQHPLALLSLADLYESLKKPELAIKVYQRVPQASPLHRNAAIQMATNLDSVDKPEEAKKELKALIAENPKDLEALVALGNIQRSRKEFADCADTYGKGIEQIANPQKSNWLIFYFRGICYERSKQWPKAEADLKKALELYPEQANVLNYLGYSWVDQGLNLDEGMAMIKRAVQQRPDDGYIVDSLGWAYYRIGNFEEAVKNLERAVDLKPEDPTINDHLGDAYWRVGRVLEAKFQWAHARDLKPEPEELPKIEAKIANGLTEETSSQAKAVEKPKKDGGG
ncbi:MAG: tetratricopeptide repeat protein [Pseudolabrys sp.]|nr:tetratricopeptide repeat protein [Pseudolabrys sp.]MCW5683492.1 tetratricopeptide repeat protein [Pseudolabrys sp.]